MIEIIYDVNVLIILISIIVIRIVRHIVTKKDNRSEFEA